MPLRLLLIVLLACCIDSPAQVRGERTESPRKPDVAPVFQRIERGIATGTVDLFSEFFGNTVSLRLGAEDQGIISGNQARAILSTYFLNNRPTSFAFSKTELRAALPYATGRLTHNRKGIRGTSQVYVSVQSSGGRWRITQFNIY
jgi:hypothetical protein